MRAGRRRPRPARSGGTYPFEVAFDYSYDGTLRSLEHSLQRLGTNAHRHRAHPRREPALAGRSRRAALRRGDERRVPRAGRAARGRRDQGDRCRRQRLGASCCASRPTATSTASCSPAATRCSTTRRSTRFMPDCERRGISVLMAAPFNSGILATGARARRDVLLLEAPTPRSWSARGASRRCARGTASHSPPRRCSSRSRIRPSQASSRACAARARSAQNLAHCARTIPAGVLGRAEARRADRRPRADAGVTACDSTTLRCRASQQARGSRRAQRLEAFPTPGSPSDEGVPRARSSACSRSAIKSAVSSMPTDRRSRSSGTGEPAPSTLARCSIRLSTPPSDVARFQSATLAAVARRCR